MRILIATASRHGATREIGQWLGASILREMSIVDSTTTVDVRDARDVDSVAEYDAAIIGSGVYMGRWLRDARSLIAREKAELESIPVWLFSSGPVDGSTPTRSRAEETKADWAIEHRVFGGELRNSRLSVFERAVVRMIKASDGDSRSRAEVLAWAAVISSHLASLDPRADYQSHRLNSSTRSSEPSMSETGSRTGVCGGSRSAENSREPRREPAAGVPQGAAGLVDGRPIRALGESGQFRTSFADRAATRDENSDCLVHLTDIGERRRVGRLGVRSTAADQMSIQYSRALGQPQCEPHVGCEVDERT